MSIEPTYSGECQFVTYADSSKGGPRITLRLRDRDELEAFIGMEGKRFALVLVQIGDDEQPVPPQKREPSPAKGGQLARLAGQWCKREDFARFIRPIYDRAMGGNGRSWGDVSPDDFTGAEGGLKGAEGYCRHAILVLCDVNSRRELDSNPDAAEKFNDLIRRPFMEMIGVAA